jgi:2-succinyl-5-enolpyruvyl-6-hydroxy-3-cyclohexene-1-carboxylate synthase
MTPPPANAATLLARAVVDALVAHGVAEVVLAPGSRNAPLAFAAYDAAAAGRLRLHTRIDERTAGFLALGMTRVGRRAAVVCTSGTAVANLHPAMLEAAHAGLPLVAVTADRPASMRGTGASQTTDQLQIFGGAAGFLDAALEPGDRVLHRLDEIAREMDAFLAPGADAVRPGPFGGGAGAPVHLNVQFVPPLVPDAPWHHGGQQPRGRQRAPERPASAERPEPLPAETLPLGSRTVVVAGDDAGPPARVLAEAANWPLFAEPSSGSRTGTNALRCYRLLLDGPLARDIERVVVCGHPTISRPVTGLLERADVEVVSVPPRGRWSGRPFAVDRTVPAAAVDGADDPAWLDRWRAADADVSRGLDRLLAAEDGITPHEVAGAVSRAVPPSGLLYVGASSPIRDLDLMVAPYAVGDRRRVLANRGLAGIDGTVSSAVGAALARPHGARNLALMGDVTFLHDGNGLVLGPDEPRPDLTVVVVNDDGGSIFAMLEQGAAPYADRYDRLFGTPHGVDLASLCAATRTPHWKVGSLPELEQALASPNGGIEVVEVAVRRDNRRELDARIRGLGG